MTIAVTPAEIRSTGNAVIDQMELKSRSLTDAETEIIRRSEWLRCGNPNREGVYFAAARGRGSAIIVQFLAVNGGDVALILDHDQARTAIASINGRFDATISAFGPDGDLSQYNDGWGDGWPAADRFDYSGAHFGDFDPYHLKAANIPNTKDAPRELVDMRPVWIG